jgi:hypothetical protein
MTTFRMGHYYTAQGEHSGKFTVIEEDNIFSLFYAGFMVNQGNTKIFNAFFSFC